MKQFSSDIGQHEYRTFIPERRKTNFVSLLISLSFWTLLVGGVGYKQSMAASVK